MDDSRPDDPPPSAGRPQPTDPTGTQLFAAVYARLREIAEAQLAQERPGHTLQATALVHEAWLKLGGRTPSGGDGVDRGAFLAAAAESMRRILIDHARGRRREKRGGGRVRVPLDPLELAARQESHDILVLDEAIEQLAQRDPRLAEIAKLRIYAGLSAAEAGNVLGIHPRTVRRDWQIAQAFLHRAVNASPSPPEEGRP